MARWRRRGDRAGSRFAFSLLVGLLAISSPAPPVSALAAPAGQHAASDRYAEHVAEASRRFGIPAAWIRAVMRVESRDDRRAVSRKGALGLMQLMPKTWAQLRARYGLGRDPFDPHDNILAGAAYLREMHDRYGSPGFLAAYNAGPGRYENYRDRDRPLPPETVAYVAALAPFVEDGAIREPVVLAAFHRASWTRAALFIVRADGAPNADRAPFGPPPRAASAVVPVHDLTAIAPQSGGLFVALSTPGRTP
jgi:soluble lytic murein transglycosylase-like protein